MNYKSIILVSVFCLLIFGFGVNHASADVTLVVTTPTGAGDATFDFIIGTTNLDYTINETNVSITTVNGYASQVVAQTNYDWPYYIDRPYYIVETAPSDWAVVNPQCNGSGAYYNPSGSDAGGINSNVNDTCTFNNYPSNSATTGSIKVVINTTTDKSYFLGNGGSTYRINTFHGVGEKTLILLKPTSSLMSDNYVMLGWENNVMHVICDKDFYSLPSVSGVMGATSAFGITVVAGETTTCTFSDGPMPSPLPDTVLPLITNEISGEITSTSIIFNWTTNHPTTSRVLYDTISHPDLTLGTAPNYGYADSTIEIDDNIPPNGPLTTQHSVLVSGLIPGTTYYFRTASRGSPESISQELKANTKSNDGQPENLNPVPTIKNISPASAIVDRKALTITINGTGFVPESIVEFDDDNLKTTYVSKTQLKATIPSSEFFFAKIGKNNLAVTNPNPGGGTSNIVSFTINNPKPSIKSIVPNSVMAQGNDQMITINGTGFLPNSVGYINGVAKTDDEFWYVSKNLMLLRVQSTDILKVGSMSITVSNPNPGGGTTLAKKLTIKPFKNPIPKITSISQASIVAGSTIPLTLHVNGTNFVSGSKVKFGGVEKETVLIHGASGDYLEAIIPASDLAVVGGFNVRVFNPAPGGGTSLPKKFTVEKPKPYIDTTLSNTTTLNDIEIQLALIAAEVAKIVAESN